jgi:hypothetical protein
VIGSDDVMPMLLEAAPSFSARWSEIEDDPMFLDAETGTRLHDIDVACFAPHVVGLQRSGATSELARLFAVIELLHIDGDKYAVAPVVARARHLGLGTSVPRPSVVSASSHHASRCAGRPGVVDNGGLLHRRWCQCG